MYLDNSKTLFISFPLDCLLFLFSWLVTVRKHRYSREVWREVQNMYGIFFHQKEHE